MSIISDTYIDTKDKDKLAKAIRIANHICHHPIPKSIDAISSTITDLIVYHTAVFKGMTNPIETDLLHEKFRYIIDNIDAVKFIASNNDNAEILLFEKDFSDICAYNRITELSELLKFITDYKVWWIQDGDVTERWLSFQFFTNGDVDHSIVETGTNVTCYYRLII